MASSFVDVYWRLRGLQSSYFIFWRLEKVKAAASAIETLVVVELFPVPGGATLSFALVVEMTAVFIAPLV